MELKVLDCRFSVCKIKDLRDVDFSDEYVFFSKTDEELSLVCRSESVPKNRTALEEGWRGFRVQGELDFSLIGILSKLSTLLADKGISIFAISTYNTDYILIKEEKLAEAMEILQINGYAFHYGDV
ncbi:MAG: ACT domain-containing protein [Eubacteriales bacterium]|nr:ACT domain-containing protein [Eubacteriales bacterium]